MPPLDTPSIGRVFLEFGDGGSPQAYTRVCEMTGVSGLGETNSLVDVTTFCSGGTREFIGGLAEGSEITIDANFIVDSDARRAFITAVKNKTSVAFRMVCDPDGDGVTDLTFWWEATALGWNFSPSIDDKNAMSYTFKVSGSIAITEP